MGKHLTLGDRITIQKMPRKVGCLLRIAVDLSRPASTIMRGSKKTSWFHQSKKEVSAIQTEVNVKKLFDCKILK